MPITRASLVKNSCAVLLLLVAFLIGCFSQLTQLGHYSPAVQCDRVDTVFIVTGLSRATSFAATLKWWDGPWVGYLGDGQVNAFYRPLTSLLWWIEWRLFGFNGRNAFMAIHLLWHLLACGVAVLFLRRVLGNKVAVIAVALWACCAADFFTLASPWSALGGWKDDPEMTMTLAVVACLWSLLSYWRTGKSRFLGGAIVFQLVGITIKEMSYITPLLAALLTWFEWPRENRISRRGQLSNVGALLLIVIAAYLFRGWALQGPGYRFGSNGAWLSRFLLFAVGGRPVQLLFFGETGPVGIALALMGTYALWHRKWKTGGAFLGIGSMMIVFNDIHDGEAFSTLNQIICLSLIGPSWLTAMVRDAFNATIVMALWFRLFNRSDRQTYFGIGWLWLSYSPLLTAPITEHALYLPSLGWAIALAVLLKDVVKETIMILKSWLSAPPFHFPQRRIFKSN